jgi:flagellar motor protein MotB
MSFKGFGASQKLYPLENDAREMEENRRVEIKIVGK